jgi:hypothetical protein
MKTWTNCQSPSALICFTPTEQDEVLSSITKLVAGVRSAEDADAANKERAALEAAFKALEDRVRRLMLPAEFHCCCSCSGAAGRRPCP